jgi:hypothetical protein
MTLFLRLHARSISITRQVIIGEFSPEEAIMSSAGNQNGVVSGLGSPWPEDLSPA